jgi:glycogenin glucosyltransferase
MYYEVPVTQPAADTLSPIFPWEAYAPKPTRVFLDEASESDAIPLPSLSPSGSVDSQHAGDDSVVSEMPRMTRDLWQTYIRANVWDEIPEIERYMQQAFQRPRTAKVQIVSGSGSAGKEDLSSHGPRWPSMRLTDFPPSLTVTPAPTRRSNLWIGERDEYEDLPAAKGVPKQEEWVRLTVDAFAKILQATYLYWKITEPLGPSRGTSTSTI